MQRNRLLWMLMLALLVPALALSGCDNKKKKSRDKDDDESAEKSEKKKNNVVGVYDLDKESTLALMKDEFDESGADLILSSEVDIDKDEDFDIVIKTNISGYNNNLNTNMSLDFDLSCKGPWSYDKNKRILNLNITDVKIYNVDVTFSENNKEVQDVINAAGGFENYKKELMDAFDTSYLKNKLRLNITKMDEDGFDAELDSKTVRFKRVD